MKWEVVIGLETHAQLSTRSKMFSGAPTAFGAAPKAVGAPEKIFDAVESWAWVSRPMTTSHFMARAVACGGASR